MAYAENTEISVERSIAEIVGLIKKAGAVRVAQIEEPDRVAVQFFLLDRMLRFTVALPNVNDIPQTSPAGRYRDNAARVKIAIQMRKQRARALLLVIKAKLESVESGVESFEEAFLAHVVTPSGETVGDWLIPQIGEAYRSGAVPTRLLPAPEEAAQ